MGSVLLIVALAALLVAFGIGMLAQRRRGHVDDGVAIYGVDDAVVYIWERLPESIAATTGRSDVRRILEWEMRYLQRPSRGDGPAVVGSIADAEFIQERAYEAGQAYEPDVIFAVLDLQADYLLAIGAIGDAAE
ncbi:MAG TPA: hypothetical protein VFD97_07885 [Acidimicrobiia bacterium]|nr:hypothetical protein [Acidimicrobiia bacterium]